MLGHMDVACVWKRKGKAFKPKNKIPKLESGGGSFTVA